MNYLDTSLQKQFSCFLFYILTVLLLCVCSVGSAPELPLDTWIQAPGLDLLM